MQLRRRLEAGVQWARHTLVHAVVVTRENLFDAFVIVFFVAVSLFLLWHVAMFLDFMEAWSHK